VSLGELFWNVSQQGQINLFCKVIKLKNRYICIVGIYKIYYCRALSLKQVHNMYTVTNYQIYLYELWLRVESESWQDFVASRNII
jgi:hypothetical protein